MLGSNEEITFNLLPRERKGSVLHAADFGCLKAVPTLNVTNGCLFSCVYCYARGYAQAPPKGVVQLYANLPALLQKELSRKRVLPAWVALNTSSDCFQPHPEILGVSFRAMQLLLDHGVGISFLTKGEIPGRFIELFARFPGKVLAQVGLVALSESYHQEYEPGTPGAEVRLRNIRNLREAGITSEVRLDPMIPFLTDTEREVGPLFARIREAGAERVTLSYLHLRRAIREQLRDLPASQRKLIEACYGGPVGQPPAPGIRAQLLSASIRQRGYERVRRIAAHFNLRALVCGCKNPDLQSDLCHAGRTQEKVPPSQPPQLTLFDS